ncbi:saccharopine dehydrogenase NADP-binding domain-containing protein [Aquincola sp. S2]|uniref:Saccharopine dehydrogenase NADP-binding domain-containing protein n=1 Tax=Pseudaquabacterium terrae TaxID=2732868 RepID=A0ABX2EAU1_9BURK|nr:saccharopine dehydrogenase NADP-binding domain-containing protein [Aquabacterium terrae]NRF65857.1 saccharopine dehydrogenase NADP-binding domain-containing protein [Aquabacterium terrae]
MSPPSRDVVVFGATSFVGKILCRYLLEQFGTHGGLKWAAAGRSRPKLEELRESLGPKAKRLPLIVADAADDAALHKLCAGARVVVSTVGPYALHGEPLVKACAESGTDYCDLTGEVQWIRRMVQRHEAAARQSGARIVHCCGFDSIPSDLGVHFLQREAMRQFGAPCTRVKMRVESIRGGLSGGTVASMMNVIKEAVGNPALRKELADPYSLCPPGRVAKVRQHEVRAPERDPDFDAWIAPFVMSAINTRIVHRTNALSEQAYGADFRYDEATLMGRGLAGRLAATAMVAGLAGSMLAGAIGPLRAALERFVLPKPGEGPSPDAQRDGGFDLRFVGTTADGRQLRSQVTGDRDPGYGSTGKMLGQAAACLALDVDKAAKPGGFWTPASLFGDRLVQRLQAHAGLSFELISPA